MPRRRSSAGCAVWDVGSGPTHLLILQEELQTRLRFLGVSLTGRPPHQTTGGDYVRHSKADRERRVLHTQDRSKWVHTSAKHRDEGTPGHPAGKRPSVSMQARAGEGGRRRSGRRPGRPTSHGAGRRPRRPTSHGAGRRPRLGPSSPGAAWPPRSGPAASRWCTSAGAPSSSSARAPPRSAGGRAEGSGRRPREANTPPGPGREPSTLRPRPRSPPGSR